MSMRRISPAFFSCVLVALLCACSDDTTAPPLDTSTQNDARVDAASADGSDDAAVKDQAVADGSKSDGPVSDGSAADHSASMTTISGQVRDPEANAGVVGAAVSVVGASPANTTTSSANGAYSLKVPINQPLLIRAVKVGYYDGQHQLPGKTTPATDVELTLVKPAFVTSLAVGAGVGTVDPSKGAIVVDFKGTAGAGVESATLSAASAATIAFDKANQPKKSPKLLPGGGSVLVFLNVTLPTTTISFSPSACSLVRSAVKTLPVRAKTTTQVQAICGK